MSRYKVPFVNFPKHFKTYEKEFMGTIREVLTKGDLILRHHTSDFEKNLAEYVGTKYAIGLSNGTSSLILSLRVSGIKAGDEVITVSHTFMATISAIVLNGAIPVLVDVNKDFNMNMDEVERAITPKTKAIIPVHLNGRICDMERLMNIAKKHNLIVIEDAAQSLGATFNGQMAGSFGLAGSFSFYPFKLLGAFGDAGAITTNDEEIYKQIRMLREHGENKIEGEREFYYHGYNERIDNLHAAILYVKLTHIKDYIDRRREIAEMYKEGLKDIKNIYLPHFEDKRFYDVYQNYVIRYDYRDKLVECLEEQGVETLISWPKPNYRHKVMQPNNYNMPETEKICKTVVSLPMNPELSNEEVNYVIEIIKNFFN